MKSIVSSHNKQILTLKNKQVRCNCRVKNSCPLDDKYLTSADVTNNLDDECKYYVGLAETTLKEQYGDYKSSFKNENSKKKYEIVEIFLAIKRK